KKLLPFIWGTLAKKGQLFGSPARGSSAQITNGLKFSYPGYSELLCGFADPRIDSNKKIPNPNVTVLEWLNNKPAFKDKVWVLGCWDVLPAMINVERSKLHCNGDGLPFPTPTTEKQRLINEISDNLPRYWGDSERWDAIMMQV